VDERSELIHLPAGTVLQVQATAQEKALRHSVRLIGSLPGHSLVITTPTVGGNVQIVREGQRFAVRVLNGERVFGFVSQVIHVAVKPYPHLHLEYPKEFEQIVVRNASRVAADVPASVRNTALPNEPQNFVSAMIVDLSDTGAKLSSEMPLGSVDDMLHLRFDLTISGETEELGLIGAVRNVHEREDGVSTIWVTGLQFKSLSRYQQVLLHAWVTGRVLRQTLDSAHR
jgi:c-di-GMP-binding flagellar brake protein YcgR